MMGLLPVRFGAAEVTINQTGLDYFADKSQLYIRYKKDFNALEALKNKAQKQLNRMSDQTSINLNSTSFYKGPSYDQDFFRMTLKATVSTLDADRNKTISRTIERKKLEPIALFWRRVLHAAQKMDRVLGRPTSPPDDPSGKKGHYTIEGPK